jgi:uncharacterized protein
MPLITTSDYIAPALLPNKHLQTIFPALFRKVSGVRYDRERIETFDKDFIDLDWSRTGSRKLGILCHGLEGDSQRPYMLGMVRMLNREGYDAMSINFRGCSGESNSRLRFYHSGASDDVDHIVDRVIKSGHYNQIVLIGFSLGGNLLLKYLGEKGSELHPMVRKAVVFSVPCNLADSAQNLCNGENRIYHARFMKSLKKKIKEKALLQPGKLSLKHLDKLKTLTEFDEKYTAPLHGFKDAADYYKQCSSCHFIKNIRIPTLIVNAKNDPFLSLSCFPTEEVRTNQYVFLEIPAEGGHCGFYERNSNGDYWSEKRAWRFLSEKSNICKVKGPIPVMENNS